MVKITTARLLHYAIAVFTVVLTILFMLLLHQAIDVTTSPFLLFFVPIIVSTLFGGLEMGVLATILTTLAIAYFFLPPFYNLLIYKKESLRIILFVGQGILFSGLIDIYQNSKRKIEANFRKLQTKEETLRLAVDAAYMGTWDWNVQTGKVVWSETHEILFGLKPGTFKGNYQTFLELIHPEDRASISAAIDISLNSKTDYKNEFRVIWPDGSIHWLAGRGKFFYDRTGKPTRKIGVIWEIGDRKKIENAQKFMSEASKLLASSLDYEITLASIVKLAVPEIADWCAIDILQEDNSIQRLAVAHVDPAKVELAYKLHRRYPPNLDRDRDPAINALRTGKPELASEISDSMLANSARDPEHLEILRQLNLRSYIVVPLVARGRSLGVITFVTAESGKIYQLSDLSLAEELAQCAAFAIDNARLYRDSEAARLAAQEAERRKDESLALLDSLVATAPIGFAFFDPKLRCVRMNDYIAAINGVPVAESIDRTMREFLPEFADIVEPIFQQILHTGEPILNVEISGETKANIGEQHALANYYPVYSPDKSLLGIGVVLANITTLKKQEEAVRQSEARLRRLVESNIIGVVFADMEKITEANNAFLEMVGYSREDLLAGKIRWRKITPSEYFQVDMQAVDQLLKDRFCTPFEKEYIRPDGSRVSVLIGAATVQTEPLEWICFILDITPIKQLEKALRHKADELEQASRMKDEFLAVVSHELRSPLNAILGWSNMLRSRNLNEDMMGKALETIERNARSQKQLIEDLLDVSRIITGKLCLKLQPIDIAPIAQTVIESLHPTAQAKDISLTFNFDLAVGKISADPERLQQIIWNLVSNAIKFTPAGGRVEVSILLAENSETGESIDSKLCTGGFSKQPLLPIENLGAKPTPTNSKLPNYAQITVTDTGMGISAEFLPYVFDRFRQADSTTTRSYGGLGLGLSIVRNLVELHGGNVSVTSPGKGQGATFTVKLPILKNARSKAGSRLQNTNDDRCFSENTSLEPLQGLRLLVVDDDLDAREFLSTALQTYGAQVKTVASAQEALSAIEEYKPDVLVSDIGMPQEDGYSLIRKVRSLSETQGGTIPAVALTAYARGEDRNRAIAEGFQMHFSKPIEPSQLVKALATLIER